MIIVFLFKSLSIDLMSLIYSFGFTNRSIKSDLEIESVKAVLNETPYFFSPILFSYLHQSHQYYD